jgi:hypothetical protein
MSKLDAVIGAESNDDYNEGFNAGINFVKTVIISSEFEDKLFKAIIKANTNNDINIRIIDTLKEFNL